MIPPVRRLLTNAATSTLVRGLVALALALSTVPLSPPFLSRLSTTAYAAPGDLDPSFGGDGIVTTDFFGVGADGAFAVVRQPDGKLLVAGTALRPEIRPNGTITSNYDFALARYHPDGLPDLSFGIDGKVTTNFFTVTVDRVVYGLNDLAFGVALQQVGSDIKDIKIVVAGTAHNPISGNDDVALARYNLDGSLDTSFGGDGKVTTDFGGNDIANAVTIQPDGRIVVAGYSSNDVGNRRFALARYNLDGSLDTSFDGDGKVITDGGDVAYAVVVQPDKKIVAVGYGQPPPPPPSKRGRPKPTASTSNDFRLVRYNPNGSLDTTFGIDGKVFTDFLGAGADSWDVARAIVRQPDGKLLVAGYAFESHITILPDGSSTTTYNYDFALARYNLLDGSLDTTFGTGGKVTTDFLDLNDQARGLALQADGKVVVVGQVAGSGVAVARYNLDGSLDTTFGTDGKVITDIVGLGFEEANAVVVQPNGNIRVAGSVHVPTGDPTEPWQVDFAVLGYLP